MPTTKRTDDKEEHGFTQSDWEAVSENPEWTEADFRQAKPFAELFPEVAEELRKGRGRPKADSPKKQVTLRLDADVVEFFRSAGPGWQSRINDSLRSSAGLEKRRKN
jgi:uncharacterized protein (DUF4415 family)